MAKQTKTQAEAVDQALDALFSDALSYMEETMEHAPGRPAGVALAKRFHLELRQDRQQRGSRTYTTGLDGALPCGRELAVDLDGRVWAVSVSARRFNDEPYKTSGILWAALHALELASLKTLPPEEAARVAEERKPRRGRKSKVMTAAEHAEVIASKATAKAEKKTGKGKKAKKQAAMKEAMDEISQKKAKPAKKRAKAKSNDAAEAASAATEPAATPATAIMWREWATTNPESFDGFGTHTLREVGLYRDKAIRLVCIDPKHFDWQVGRYRSDMTNTNCPPEELVNLASLKDYTIVDEQYGPAKTTKSPSSDEAPASQAPEAPENDPSVPYEDGPRTVMTSKAGLACALHCAKQLGDGEEVKQIAQILSRSTNRLVLHSERECQLVGDFASNVAGIARTNKGKDEYPNYRHAKGLDAVRDAADDAMNR